MPIPNAVQRQIFVTASRSLEYKTGIPNVRTYAQQLAAQLNVDPREWGFTSSAGVARAVENVVRVAKESRDMGAYITQTGYEVLNVPRVPAGPEWLNDYRYRVVVGVTDASGRRTSDIITVYSAGPIDYSTIGTRAIEEIHTREGSGRTTLTGSMFDDVIGTGGTIDVYVLSAGRR